MMKDALMIGLGAFLGANTRYAVSTGIARLVDASLPWGTLLVNVVGSFILGLFLALTTERLLVNDAYRLLIAVGFCGSYTTFSSYAYETVALVNQGHVLDAVGNLVLNNALTLVAVLAGIAIARWIHL